ncbi:alpha/beta hydrolase [Dactylosporangium sp. NPDC049140]|uniref:dienelactone hydrolase family protein n=1 Tax=Dactylosporangium sp. NPDC049140 TaxID=3155647 RepID=UPI0033FED866
MRFTSSTSSDGVAEQSFTLDGIPGVLWTPEGATGPRPLVVLGHGGGQHKRAPGVAGPARRFVTGGGFAVVAVDAPGHGDRPQDETVARMAAENRAAMASGDEVAPRLAALHTYLARQAVPEWSAVVTAVQELDHVGAGPVGYRGLSMGCGLGLPFVAAEPRVRAAVLGLCGPLGLAGAASRITAPVLFLLQWDDALVPREAALALFDALASPARTLHANPGNHGDVPRFETDSALHFFGRHLV